MGVAGNGYFIEAAARKLEIPDGDPNAAILKLSKSARLQVGEAQQRVTATLSLVASDDEVANHILSVGQGLVSLLKLQKDKPAPMKIADAVTLKQDGASVVATLAMSSSDLIELMKADAARKAARKAEKERAEEEVK